MVNIRVKCMYKVSHLFWD